MELPLVFTYDSGFALRINHMPARPIGATLAEILLGGSGLKNCTDQLGGRISITGRFEPHRSMVRPICSIVRDMKLKKCLLAALAQQSLQSQLRD